MKKTIKRIFASLIVVVIVLTAAPLSGFVGIDFAHWSDLFSLKAEAVSGTCGDNLTWSFDEATGELIISGTGSMHDYYFGHLPWHDYIDEIETAIIGDNVTYLDEDAFVLCNLVSINVDGNNDYYSSDNLGVLYNKDKTELIQYPINNKNKSFIIPNSVNSIGDGAFYSCNYLEFITIPDSVTSIGVSAFSFCYNLLSIEFPNRITTIENSILNDCYSLTEVIIPDSVVYIGLGILHNCYSLTDIYYKGSEAEWKKISIGSSNDDLISATIHYNYSPIADIVSNSSVGDVVKFGSYPQSEVKDSTTLFALNSLQLNWVSYGYYSGIGATGQMKPGDWMKYADIEYESKKYRGVIFSSYRPHYTGDICTESDSNQDDNGYYTDNIYWFEYEPLEWRVLDPAEGFILCESVIDAQAYSNVVHYDASASSDSRYCYFNSTACINYASDYETSSIREWLNDDFYNTAFTFAEKAQIGETTLDNSCYFSKYPLLDSATTHDKIFLLSYSDVQNTLYNFSNGTDSSSTRHAKPTAYAKAQGVYVDSSCGTSFWWLRSPRSFSYSASSVNSNGNVNYYIDNTVDDTLGIRPALKINSKSENPELETQCGINIPEDIVFIEKDGHYLFSAYDKNGNDITDKVDWSSTTSVDCTGEVKITNKGDVLGAKQGLTNLHASYWDKETLENLGDDSCYVFVGEPNEVKYTSVSDQIYYYGENAFYSDAGQFSNSVDIYIALENAIHEQIEFLTEYDEYADEFEKLAINGYTLYASVSGSNLSFDKDEYINNYISAFDGNIPIDKAVDELLTLYPYNLDVSSADKRFTVTIKIESEDFETITASFTFKISSLEDKEINEHISFIDGNGSGSMYKAMRDNDFATGMSDLKNDSQYIWSKYSILDFENYHEILMADILVKLMETQLVGNISLLPVLKEWNSNYNTILSSVSTIVEDSYAGSMEITDNLLDKVIKKSKYTTEGMDVHDEVRDLVVLKLRDKVSIDKINKAFAAVDKTGQCLDLFDMSVNITNDIADWVDCVSIMNSYQNMNEEFKNVIQKVYDCIPNDDWKVKEAVNHYVKLDTTAGYTQEVIESVIELSKDITLEVFNSVFKEQFISMFTNAIGSITLKSGALLSSTTAFSAISTGLGAISTGATLGLCISDILCNNSGQAEEMGKVVAASQLAPYVIQTLKYYEWALKNYKDESSLKHFEVAFNLNKALQIYSIEHTYKGLEIQANSIIIKLFSRRDYPGAMAELASLKTSHINCNCCEDVYTGVIKTKTIAIKCPVDVYIYDENGKEVVRIINDVSVYVENGINVFINGREKYVTVPADQEYSVKIVATDEGTMDYLVIEHDETGQYDRIVKSLNIDLNKNQTFTGKVCEEFDVNKDSYALNTNGNVIKPSVSIDASNEIGGICGDNVTWAFDKSTGELVISGTGDMYENGDEWNEYRDSIVAVRIENGVTSIIDYAFSGYANLVDIVIPDSVTKVGRQICRDTPFYENQANWENGSLYIGNHLIETKYDYVGICTIKDGTKTIASSAFYDCYDLTGVIIPESVIGIGDTAFYSCYRLEQVSIPKNVLKIGDDAFGYCDVLQYINVDVHNPYYSSVDGVLYNKNRTELICYPMGKTEESFVVPNGVKVIKKSAFELCKLESIIIADSVTIIESIAFKECPNLKSVVLSKNISNIEKYAFIYSTTITDVYYNNTRDAWNRIKIEEYNDPLLNSIIHFAGKVHSISIDDISMSYKDSATISPAIYADSGVKYTVSYSSSDDSVVSVDQNGKITTRDTGSATITVTVTDEYGNTVSDTCNVEVKYTWWQWIIVIVLFGWIWY